MTPETPKPRRLLLEREGTVSVYEVVQDRVVLGRDPGADLVLSHHRVSRRHAELRLVGGTLLLEDLGSSNGTFVNGLPALGCQEMVAGDRIGIGPFVLHVDHLAGAAQSATPSPLSAATPRRATVGSRRQRLLVPLAIAAGLALFSLLVIPSLLNGNGQPAPDGAGIPAEAPPLVVSPPPPPVILPPPSAPDAEEARRAFELACLDGRFRDAASFLRKLGDPPELMARLQEAMDHGSKAARKEAKDLQERMGLETAAAYLRRRLDDFPRESRARGALAEMLLELPVRVPAGEGEGPVVEVAQGDPGEAPSGQGEAHPPPVEEEPRERPTPAVVDLKDKLVQAESALADRELNRAEALFREVIQSTGERTEARHRAARGLRAATNHRALVRALEHRFAQSPEDAGRLPLPGGRTGPLLGIDSEGLLVEGVGEPLRLRWRVVPLGTLKSLVRKANLAPDSLVAAASVLRGYGEENEFEALLRRAFARDPSLKGAIDLQLADARGMTTVPDGGFTLVEEAWLSPQQLARLETNRQIERACQDLLADESGRRAQAYEELRALGDTARSRLHRGLLIAKAELREKLKKVPGYAALEDIAAQREELDRRRAHALQLIFDLDRYPYPFRPPQASPEAAAAYQESQPEIDSRVARVRELWKERRTVPIPPAVRLLVHRIQEVNTFILQASFGEVPSDPAWLLYLPGEDQLQLDSVATSQMDRVRLDESKKVMALNAADPGSAALGEQSQCLITNEYRVMMGRWALRLYDPLVRAARGHCEDMVKNGFFSHTSPLPGKETPMQRVQLQGMEPAGLSENIAISGGPESAHNGWVHSSGHHRNILNAAWRLMGPGNAGSRWCQNFSVADRNQQVSADGGTQGK